MFLTRNEGSQREGTTEPHQADKGRQTMTNTAVRAPISRSDRLLSVVAPYRQAVIVMHNNPDPDAIATGWAIRFLLESKLHKPVRLVGSGDIVRAENRHMIRLLQPPFELLDEFHPGQGDAVILVDCGPDATNHLVCDEAIRPVAVIDHHDPQLLVRLPLMDIRPHVAASASIAATYLRQQQLEPDTRLATAMLYAIHTETQGYETYHSRVDRAVLPWLMRRADPALLAEIENAPLSREYFGDLVLALQGTFVYEDAALCILPRAQGPEIIGEVADLLIRCEGIHRVLCGAVSRNGVLLSVRTDDIGGNATRLLNETLQGLGRGGGHAHRSGGKLFLPATGTKVPEVVQDELRSRWLRACGISRQRGTRLIAKREIVHNL